MKTGYDWLTENELRKVNDYQFTLKGNRTDRLNLAELLDAYRADVIIGQGRGPESEARPHVLIDPDGLTIESMALAISQLEETVKDLTAAVRMAVPGVRV